MFVVCLYRFYCLSSELYLGHGRVLHAPFSWKKNATWEKASVFSKTDFISTCLANYQTLHICMLILQLGFAVTTGNQAILSLLFFLLRTMVSSLKKIKLIHWFELLFLIVHWPLLTSQSLYCPAVSVSHYWKADWA